MLGQHPDEHLQPRHQISVRSLWMSTSRQITVSRTSPRLNELAQAKGRRATSEPTSMPYAESNLTAEATMDIQQGVWERSSFKRAQHI
jgi:hypothetical protein